MLSLDALASLVVILFVQLKAEEVVAFAFAHHLAADALAFFTPAATEHLDVRELPFNREGEGIDFDEEVGVEYF